jgi:hypothetical protein
MFIALGEIVLKTVNYYKISIYLQVSKEDKTWKGHAVDTKPI